MPQPTGRDLHVDQLLTQLSIGYRNAQYIADEIFPIVRVRKQSDKLPQYDQSHWFRDEARLRAPGTKSQRGGYTVDTSATYYCDRFSFGKEIADDDRDNVDLPFNLDRDAAEFVTDKLQMRREVAFTGDFFKTGVWGADKVGGTDFTAWSNYGASSPLVDVSTYADEVEGKIGREANTFVIGKPVWLKLKWHPDLVDTIKYTQVGQISVAMAQALFEVERFLIGRAIYTSSPEGTAEASVTYARIWGKHGLLLYRPAAPSLMTPSAGYTFVWERVAGALQYIKRFRDEEREVDTIEGNSYFDQKRTGQSAGVFLSNAVA